MTSTPSADDYTRPYSFSVGVTFLDWPSFVERSSLEIPVVPGINPTPDFNFRVRDYCLGN